MHTSKTSLAHKQSPCWVTVPVSEEMWIPLSLYLSAKCNVMFRRGRLGVLAGLAQKGSIRPTLDIKAMQKTPKGYSLMVQLISLTKCKLLPCSVSWETSVPGGTTAGLEANRKT